MPREAVKNDKKKAPGQRESVLISGFLVLTELSF